MGMAVQSEVTSKGTIISSGSIFCWHVKAKNDLELWVYCSFSLPSGFNIYVMYFDIL